MASAAAGGAGGELLHFLKLLFHIGKYLVPEEGVFDIRHGHVLAVADDLIGGVFRD